MAGDMTLAEFLALTRDEQQRRAGRRPTRTAPVRPQWVNELPPRPRPRPQVQPDFPFEIPFRPLPSPPQPAPRVDFGALSRAEMGAFDNFSDWYNAQRRLERRLVQPELEVRPAPEPWYQPPVEQIGDRVTPFAPGTPAPRRGLEPASAPGAQREDDLDAAWNAARQRADASWAEETARSLQTIPRPGRPAISFLRWGRRPQSDDPRRR